MERSILRTGIPAAIVAAVLGFSLLVPAAASRANGQGDDNHGYGHKCGYGEVQDNDENDNEGEGGGGGDRVVTVASAVKPVAGRQPAKFDNDKCEDEEEGDNGGGSGGGDRSVGSTSQTSVVPLNTVSKPVSIGAISSVPKQYFVISNRPGSDGE
jgi:hypothetical protein